MQPNRFSAAIVCCLLACSLAGCCANPCCRQCDSPIEFRVCDGDCCRRPGWSAMDDQCAAPSAPDECACIEQPGRRLGIAVPFGDSPAGVLAHGREPAIPPPHDPWFVAVPTCPVLPVAHRAPIILPPPADEAMPRPRVEEVPPVLPDPGPGPWTPQTDDPLPGKSPAAPGPRREVRGDNQPGLLPDHRPGIGWTFRPAQNQALDQTQRGVLRVPAGTLSAPRATSQTR